MLLVAVELVVVVIAEDPAAAGVLEKGEVGPRDCGSVPLPAPAPVPAPNPALNEKPLERDFPI